MRPSQWYKLTKVEQAAQPLVLVSHKIDVLL